MAYGVNRGSLLAIRFEDVHGVNVPFSWKSPLSHQVPGSRRSKAEEVKHSLTIGFVPFLQCRLLLLVPVDLPPCPEQHPLPYRRLLPRDYGPNTAFDCGRSRYLQSRPNNSATNTWNKHVMCDIRHPTPK